ncbi:MAG TPA: hypothetical protein VNC61_10015 [Acidimicrobiales bacterium]|nr:hypothetical protein [Acidimicrobiales bacterium]
MADEPPLLRQSAVTLTCVSAVAAVVILDVGLSHLRGLIKTVTP